MARTSAERTLAAIDGKLLTPETISPRWMRVIWRGRLFSAPNR